MSLLKKSYSLLYNLGVLVLGKRIVSFLDCLENVLFDFKTLYIFTTYSLSQDIYCSFLIIAQGCPLGFSFHFAIFIFTDLEDTVWR